MISDANMYAEVFEILGCMNKQEVMRIPVNILEFIKQERSKTYQTRIDKYDLFNPDNIDTRTLNFLAWLMMDYMANDEQRKILIKKAKENDRKREEEKIQKFKIEEIKKEQNRKNDEIIQNEIDGQENTMIVVKKELLITKIINFIRRIIRNKRK